jgi:hypothetical protein
MERDGEGLGFNGGQVKRSIYLEAEMVETEHGGLCKSEAREREGPSPTIGRSKDYRGRGTGYTGAKMKRRKDAN